MWASRKGHVEIVDTLLKAGANVDTAGMVRLQSQIDNYYYYIPRTERTHTL